MVQMNDDQNSKSQTTLPDRLRKLAEGWVTTYPLARDTVVAMKEAADEIDALRKEIAEAVEYRRIEIDAIREERAAEREAAYWNDWNANYGR